MSDEVQRWEEWFKLVGLMKEWGCVKETFPDNEKAQLAWARILEFNRITELEIRRQADLQRSQSPG